MSFCGGVKVKKNNLILIGFMGVGKTTIGEQLFDRMDKYDNFIDTDHWIEKQERMSVIDIFKQKGEPYFRELEKELYQNLLAHTNNTIIATGGGFHKQDGLKSLGTVIYMSSPLEYLMDRLGQLQNMTNRPMLENKEFAKMIYERRIQEYIQAADIITDVSHKSIPQVVSQILSILDEEEMW
jgi:shikimate kinase